MKYATLAALVIASGCSSAPCLPDCHDRRARFDLDVYSAKLVVGSGQPVTQAKFGSFYLRAAQEALGTPYVLSGNDLLYSLDPAHFGEEQDRLLSLIESARTEDPTIASDKCTAYESFDPKPPYGKITRQVSADEIAAVLQSVPKPRTQNPLAKWLRTNLGWLLTERK